MISNLGFNSAVADNTSNESAGSRANQRLAEQEVQAKQLASEVVDGKMYIDNHIPKPPRYNEAPQFDAIMAVYKTVARVNEKGRENAYVWAGLKLDDANRREIIKLKGLEAKEKELDATIAKTEAEIAKYDSEKNSSKGSTKKSYIGASGASTESLTGLLGGEDSEYSYKVAEEDVISLGAIVKNKAYIVINGKPNSDVRVGQTLSNRYEVTKIDSNLQCVMMADLKTEDREAIPPVCLN